MKKSVSLFIGSFIALSLCFVLSGCGTKSTAPEKEGEMHELLHTWCDGMLEHQLDHKSGVMEGGLLCSACGIIHGRCPDAMYPLLYVSELTGDKKYKDAALKLFDWGERNVRMPDGSWSNEVSVSSWKGITVFGLIALSEAYHDFGYMLDTVTRAKWYNSIIEQADFIEYYLKPGKGNINYPASAPYALALAAEVTGKESYKARAKELAGMIVEYFTPNDHFLYGEGAYPYTASAKGLRPVDLGYNVEESLPNLLLYADFVGNDSLRSLVKRSMDTHIEFMLPDGAWDNSWGTRNYKWSYWGSRTSDGVLPLCRVLASEDPVYGEIGYRNFLLLRRFTPGKLLYGGAHYESAGYRPCLHHTFDHAKSLALALKKGFKKPEQSTPIPRDAEYGVKYFKDLDLWMVAHKNWKATVSGSDIDYKKPGGNALGGAMTVLWHWETGPLLASAMTVYQCWEPNNMQMLRGVQDYTSGLTVQYKENDEVYRNTSFYDSKVSHRTLPGGEQITVMTGLETIGHKTPASGKIGVALEYEFSGEECVITARNLNPRDKRTLELFIPLISPAAEKYYQQEDGYVIEKGTTRVSLVAENGALEILPREANGRAFIPSPGFEFIPFKVDINGHATIKIKVE